MLPHSTLVTKERRWCPDHPGGCLLHSWMLLGFCTWPFFPGKEEYLVDGEFWKCICSPRVLTWVTSPWTFTEYTQAFRELQDWPSGHAKLHKRVYFYVYPDSRGIILEWTFCSLNLVPCWYDEQSQCEILFINTSNPNIKLSQSFALLSSLLP